ncbi:Hsp70 family protein [Dactylosporangium sp. CS-047395]|uniref:Hsp70 family protein n=1 Tax=Dactylosporangium sp. CS-047395 TaxID=3239936 RepID=UPI003D92B8DB
MIGGGYRLGVDFGTSNTVAVLAWPDGRTRPLTFDGSPLLPSAVYADPDGPLLAGRDARHWARRHPERFEPYPKRRIDDGTVLLGEREVGVVELFAAVLSRVAAEAGRVAGSTPERVTVTCPVSWGRVRRELLVRAAVEAGLPHPAVVDEPVAAAAYFVTVLGTDLPVGAHLVVYDLGAGTFDATVVARTADGFAVVASTGLADRGGLDIDAAVVEHLRTAYADHAGTWQQLTEPAHRDAWLDLAEHVRDGKEMLSRSASTFVRLPLLDVDAPLGREELDGLAAPVLDETVAAVATALRDLPAPPAALFLVGGASRMPLVSTVVHRSTGLAPVVIEQPELIVAEGALHAATEPVLVSPPPPALVSAPRPALVSASVSAPPRSRPRDYLRPALILLAMALVVVVIPAIATANGAEALGTGLRTPLGPAGFLTALAFVAMLALPARAAAVPLRTGPPPPGRLLALAATASAALLVVLTSAAMLNSGASGRTGGPGHGAFRHVLTAADRWLPLVAIAAGLAVVAAGLRGLATRRPLDVLGSTGPDAYALAAAAGTVLGGAALTHWYARPGTDPPPGQPGIAVEVARPADDPVLYVAHRILAADGWTAATLWLAVALGVAVALTALVFAGSALREAVALCPPRVRQYLAGAVYGLCLTAGAYLAYHAVAEVRYWTAWRLTDGRWSAPPSPTDLAVAAGDGVWRLGWWPAAGLIALAAVAGLARSARGPRLYPARRPPAARDR